VSWSHFGGSRELKSTRDVGARSLETESVGCRRRLDVSPGSSSAEKLFGAAQWNDDLARVERAQRASARTRRFSLVRVNGARGFEHLPELFARVLEVTGGSFRQDEYDGRCFEALSLVVLNRPREGDDSGSTGPIIEFHGAR